MGSFSTNVCFLFNKFTSVIPAEMLKVIWKWKLPLQTCTEKTKQHTWKYKAVQKRKKNTLVVEVKQGCKNIRGMKDINEVTHFTCHVVMPKKEKCFIIWRQCTLRRLLGSQAPVASFLKTKFGFRWAREMHPRGYLVSILPSGLLCWVPTSIISSRQIVPVRSSSRLPAFWPNLIFRPAQACTDCAQALFHRCFGDFSEPCSFVSVLSLLLWLDFWQ